MPRAGFEPAIPAINRPQTYALDRAAIAISYRNKAHRNRHMKLAGKVVSTRHQTSIQTFHPGNIPGTHFSQRLSRPQGHSTAGRIMSIKNSNDHWNRTRDLLQASSPESQPIKFRIIVS